MLCIVDHVIHVGAGTVCCKHYHFQCCKLYWLSRCELVVILLSFGRIGQLKDKVVEKNSANSIQ